MYYYFPALKQISLDIGIQKVFFKLKSQYIVWYIKYCFNVTKSKVIKLCCGAYSSVIFKSDESTRFNPQIDLILHGVCSSAYHYIY